MYDFSNFTTLDAVKCGRGIRTLGSNSQTMEEAADEIVHFFYDNFIEQQNQARSCALVRLFKTHDYASLDDDLKAFARNMLDGADQVQGLKCFTLLATCGVNPEWASRRNSKGHQAIPLPSIQVVKKIPMMRNMVKQMGLGINSVIDPDPAIVMDLTKRTFNVFHVADTKRSPYVPAQEEFVIPYGVKSVLGFGGVLPSGNVFAVIIFSRTPISRETANYFTTLALNVKMVILPFEKAVFPRKDDGNSDVSR
ncbi:MAG TPA: hypothetical protein VMB78_11585 [Dissulfurispiraceae bacterium]|nr:hypothetical protein [Dissulfurispiraceae bacterium]